MAKTIEGRGMGWLPDYPDFRDYTVERAEVSSKLEQLGEETPVRAMLQKVGVAEPAETGLPGSQNLRRWCSPVEDQGSLGSCTAQAAAAIVEYFERRAHGNHIDASRLFLYKATRNLLHWSGDTGAYLRTTMGALVLFGVPPEEYWPYDVANFDEEPPAFCYAFAQSYQTISYYRLDPPETTKRELLKRIKTNLAGGLPSMFGFTVYSSINQASSTGKIPYPAPGEKTLGGHAVVAIGYDDDLTINNANGENVETTGALMVRNSWGTGWGDDGYGWLPYEYVLKGQAVDWWSLLKNEWVDTEAFRR
jgi:C1A family cysteine protease